MTAHTIPVTSAFVMKRLHGAFHLVGISPLILRWTAIYTQPLTHDNSNH